jgi:hypothetical protein
MACAVPPSNTCFIYTEFQREEKLITSLLEELAMTWRMERSITTHRALWRCSRSDFYGRCDAE